MNVKIDKQEKSKVVLEFTMDAEEFKIQLDKAFIKNAKLFSVPGFRKGKVPRNIVEKIYGENVLYDTVIEDNVDKEYAKAVEENKLEIVSKPQLEIIQIEKGKEFIYNVTVYIKPAAKVTKYKGLEIEKINLEVTDKDLEEKLEDARNKNARVVTVEGRALENNDISVIDFEGFVDGVAFEGGKGEKFELTIGSGQFIPGFEEQLIGMKPDEQRDVKVKFPEEYHSKDLSGKDAIFKVKLLSMKAKILPNLDDEFAKDVSEFETLAEFKKDLEEKLHQEKEKNAKFEKEEKAIAKLIENTEVEIPEPMIEDQMDQQLEQFKTNLSYKGLDIDTYCKYIDSSEDKIKVEFRPNAIKDIKLKLALEYISNNEEIKIDAKDIDEKIKELSEQYGDSDASSLMANENARNYMEEKLKQDKTLEIVLDSVIEK
ncbi:MAG: trigger factor [Clostridia bacterium]